ncbi:unnamed protein product [Lactuca saligna]|uniref:Uncharacterized protein n=1 Tax=Lactuca saligna TaxID=75948 RepID=A0AA35YWD3_LACSI|nr:unnamed protein product [Lactuca saligna]
MEEQVKQQVGQLAVEESRIQRMKTTCVANGVEEARQVVKEHVASGKFNLNEASAMVEITQAMQASGKSFMETYFSSFLHLGELDLECIRQLCRDPDIEDNPPESDPLKVGSSFNTLSK